MLLRETVYKQVWIGIFLIVFIWSAIDPLDRFTWLLEVAPAMIGFVLVILTHRAFPLTPLVYVLILIHCIILMIGGHYTYAEVPLFNDLKDLLDLDRNHYDKVGHFVQGFVPAMIARELIIRKQIIPNPGWRAFFIVCFCLALSAFYELIEWWVAVGSGEGAEAFLGTQGYVWDTQSDMAHALVGAAASLILLSRLHDRQIQKLPA
jgi:putative membrane protein